MAVWLEKGEDIYQITEPVTMLGRNETNHIVLSVDLVSRVHAMIYEKDNIYHVRDLQSHNGTYVNGEKIEDDTALHDGDIIKVGFDLTFRMGDAPPGGRSHPKRPSEVYRQMTGDLAGQKPPEEE